MDQVNQAQVALEAAAAAVVPHIMQAAVLSADLAQSQEQVREMQADREKLAARVAELEAELSLVKK